MTISDFNKELGNIDIYLLDQILKQRFRPSSRILDAGCGEGRNLTFFLRNDFDVHGIDIEPLAIRMLQMWARSIGSSVSPEQFIVGDVSKLPYDDAFFDAVISSAVLHFAEGRQQFEMMAGEMVRVLKPGGILFMRMAADVGLEGQKASGELFDLADGSTRFLLTLELIDYLLATYSLTKLEPIKFVSVEGKRVMSTLVLKK